MAYYVGLLDFPGRDDVGLRVSLNPALASALWRVGDPQSAKDSHTVAPIDRNPARSLTSHHRLQRNYLDLQSTQA